MDAIRTVLNNQLIQCKYAQPYNLIGSGYNNMGEAYPTNYHYFAGDSYKLDICTEHTRGEPSSSNAAVCIDIPPFVCWF